MTTIDFSAPITTVLEAVGNPKGPLGSGAATALVLSLGVECLSLQLSLTTTSDREADERAYLETLRDRLAGWRVEIAQAFIDDPRVFGEVIVARRRRDSAPEPERKGHVVEELHALKRANAVLLRLIAISVGLESDADVMLRGPGASHARGEAITAHALAQAANQALAGMITCNIESAEQKIRRFGLKRTSGVDLLEVVRRLPEGAARTHLEAALSDTVEFEHRD